MTKPKLGGTAVRAAELCRVAPSKQGLGHKGFITKLAISRSLGAGLLLAASSTQVSASQVPRALFDHLAASCAPGIQLPTLRAVAAVESNFEPWAIRDNTTHQTWSPPRLPDAIAIATQRLHEGHSVDVGLMQINSKNFSSLSLSLSDAFDACRSMDAARRILLSAYAAGASEPDRQAAILIAFSRYNTGRPLAGIANGYADQVIAEQHSSNFGKPTPVEEPVAQQAWNVWGAAGAQTGPWLIATNESSNFGRAGAQPTDIRIEERKAVPLLAKGEPYELFAYQESELPKP